ncbi:MAG: glycosyltransferase family 2 protein [Chloroflexi bacterium AL-W]|nr:glycosyltransferase family 2 protein [Chloroflexi bacterium AL-N1]NOK70045.1 glycosyltransferase family 2 protein [Chloroflexi bacterium AL-N10]NOK77943.1 glycosyltransferase family 2 protein [Chloroflexi bacterium AL-N5]NOK84952.1 glycosyltransferase family 2 protein [Chloroflexi bacterium AL-W]NOK91931.1 glycosyltransferase family 2 protein [Chloroflexi bacterium AL-N15]
MSSLAIVIVNYNTRELLRDCLTSIFAATSEHRIEVWVVDNASSDGSVGVVQQAFPSVHLIANTYNGGYAYANNLALRDILALPELSPARQGVSSDTPSLPDYVMLLNSDTVVPHQTIDGLIRYIEVRPDVGAVGPKLLLADGSLDLACRRAFPTPTTFIYHAVGLSRLFPRSPRFARYNMTYLDPDIEVEVDALVGACMLVRSSVVREVGLLDEQFFMYGEDLDWSHRIKQYGWRIMYAPHVIVHHYKRASSSQRPFASIRHFYHAMRVFHRKHYAATAPALFNITIEAGITLKEAWSLGRNFLRPAAARRVG